MTPRTLFNIILKILGIFSIKDLLVVIPAWLNGIIFMASASSPALELMTLVGTLLVLLTYAALAYFLIFKTELIIDKLRLDKGFDMETIPLNIHRSTVLSITLIVLGVYIAATEIPNFIKQLYYYLQYMRTHFNQYQQPISNTIISAVKIMIGYFLAREQKLLVNLIERKRKD